jgi:UDP-N-acetylglucosamine diphosphorylase/glucosamine-1-phosphate N-acetyltransferase
MKIDKVLLFEPENVENFYPFNVMHPIWEMRCGAFRIFEKYERLFENCKFSFKGREKHLKSFLQRFEIEDTGIEEDNVLAVNACVLPDKYFRDALIKVAEGKVPYIFTKDNYPYAAFIPKEEIIKKEELKRRELLSDLKIDLFSGFEKMELPNLKVLNYLHDTIPQNAKAISDDSEYFSSGNASEADFKGVHFVNAEQISIGTNVKIAPGVVLDADEGVIIIDDNVKIMPNSVIVGPAYIGKNTTIKIAAKIYQETSIGEYCKVGGEIECSIFQSFSNKQHEGFLGHSFIGEWVNFGADTNNSDLKNTYDNIKLRIDDKEIETGTMFMGLLCGDHTKTGINSMFTTGTVCGVCSIIVKEWFMPNFIPSFSWGGKHGSPIYKASKAITTAEKVMSRRGKTLTELEKELLIAEHDRVAALQR